MPGGLSFLLQILPKAASYIDFLGLPSKFYETQIDLSYPLGPSYALYRESRSEKGSRALRRKLTGWAV
jgi:hypothetical protein